MTKQAEIIQFLDEKCWHAILTSSTASPEVRRGTQLTKTRMENQVSPQKTVQFFSTAIAGTGKSIRFGDLLKLEGFTRFEDIQVEFYTKFNNAWLDKL